MTDARIPIIAQELDALRQDIAALAITIAALTKLVDRLEYRIGQQNRAMERLAQYVGTEWDE